MSAAVAEFGENAISVSQVEAAALPELNRVPEGQSENGPSPAHGRSQRLRTHDTWRAMAACSSVTELRCEVAQAFLVEHAGSAALNGGVQLCDELRCEVAQAFLVEHAGSAALMILAQPVETHRGVVPTPELEMAAPTCKSCFASPDRFRTTDKT
eukprot:CAMPEP_0202067024 /NCGR_PEP_ID=MMETSP0963-20130614/54271_1 /ASSEMBLY_ACC=CAM_ASM_000494 /TAXON_ID=4773 /ORGANISM="Schizochytrium aggregatum, Strain ATCC28209" /LENGTH=154 /DNA_ID=CAMNT_0048633733 /DNA_START=166 /DNA_END=632 /DNA_ORIENTATION=-